MIKENEVFAKSLTVTNGLGIHARVATQIVQRMQQFPCEVTLIKDDVEVSARSVLGLLLLAASPGTEILAKAIGPGSMEAIDEISRLIQDEESEQSR